MSIRKRISQTVDLRLALVALSIIIGSEVLFEVLIPNTISAGDAQIPIVLGALELTALLLPALAILLQVSIEYSHKPFMVISGNGETLRRVVFGSVGISGIGLSFAVLLLLNYLSVALPIRIAISIIVFSIALFGLIPVAQAYVRQGSDVTEVEKKINQGLVLLELSQIEELPQEYQEWLGLDEFGQESTSDDGVLNQDKDTVKEEADSVGKK